MAAPALPAALPPAKFITDVESYVAGMPAEQRIVELQDQLRAYKQREQALLLRRARLQERLPEIKSALEAVRALLARRDAGDAGEPLQADFELTEGVFARAALQDVDAVNLWLGANVMVEYPLEEARALLEENLATCQGGLDAIDADLTATKDSVTVTEVSIARVFNHSVAARRAAKSGGGGGGSSGGGGGS